jgi:glutamyl-tRNA synthetase
VGKAQKRKGKRLFMPMRIAFTGRMQGPDVGEVLGMMLQHSGEVAPEVGYLALEERMERLRKAAQSL